MDNSKSVARLVILMVISAVLVVFCIYKRNQVEAHNNELLSVCTDTAIADVKEVKSHTVMGGRRRRAGRSHATFSTYYRVKLEFKVHNSTYIMEDDTAYQLHSGESVEIHYDPKNPSRGYVGDRPSANSFQYLNFLLFPAMLLIGAALRLAKMKDAEKGVSY
ncbi:MAG: DUF3592 domain-containing protein [Ruminococcus sp.]|nr:DUF3592 domain-containing protein [Ruminococcus sp.]